MTNLTAQGAPELPPLPDATYLGHDEDDGRIYAYTADQMHAYAIADRQARQAAPEAPREPDVAKMVEEAKEILDETYRFAATSPRSQENINAVSDLLDKIEAATIREAGPLATPAVSRAEGLEPAWKLQFLTDVVTAAGLLEHGKRDKGLAERIGESAFRWRKELFSARSVLPAQEVAEKLNEARVEGDARYTLRNSAAAFSEGAAFALKRAALTDSEAEAVKVEAPNNCPECGGQTSLRNHLESCSSCSWWDHATPSPQAAEPVKSAQPEDFGIPTEFATRAAHYAAHVASETLRNMTPPQAAEGLSGFVHSDDSTRAATVAGAGERIDAAQAAESSAVKVYLIATGEFHGGYETYTRHDNFVPMCDYEVLYTQAAEPVPVEAVGEDTKLLDWLESNECTNVFKIGSRWYTRDGYNEPHRRAKDLRAAIRVAIAASPSSSSSKD